MLRIDSEFGFITIKIIPSVFVFEDQFQRWHVEIKTIILYVRDQLFRIKPAVHIVALIRPEIVI